MNFFDHQDVARKKTRWLSYAYAFTLLLIVLAAAAWALATLIIGFAVFRAGENTYGRTG